MTFKYLGTEITLKHRVTPSQKSLLVLSMTHKGNNWDQNVKQEFLRPVFVQYSPVLLRLDLIISKLSEI